MVLLLWAWADSTTHYTWWDYIPSPLHRYRLTLADSRLSLTHSTFADPDQASFEVNRPWGGLDRFTIRKGSRPKEPTLFPPPKREMGASIIMNGPAIYQPDSTRSLPFWLMLACYLPPWLLLTWWQARRRRRKQEAGLPAL